MEQPVLPEIKPYVNRNLFSDHFLRELLPKDESWAVDEDKLGLAVQATLNLYASRREELPHLNEAQLEQEFVRPLLESLGHVFQVQPSLPTSEGVRRPDYAFFATREDKRQAGKHKGKLDYFKKAIAIGDAKQWARPLDKRQRRGTDKFDMLSPSWQIDYYLRTSEVPWAILTDGRLWRLYNRETSFRLDVYYEIDLPQLLAARDIEAFKYFYLFFRRQAFVCDPEGLCFLDRVYQGSLEYAREVGDGLKDSVYKALRILAEGFLETPGNNLDPSRDLEEIHANALIYLYRLLFINYAEDRRLLPRDTPLYKETYGLVSMEGEIASKLERQESLSPLQATYWEKLRVLFDLINRGSEPFGIDKDTLFVPPYNGGLFDPQHHAFLEENRVADCWLAQVVDLLARSKGEGVGRAFVDYSNLDVRHLGSIYEGLLEYRLRVADEQMAAIRRRGREEWVSASEAEGKKVLEGVQPGQLYLATDRGERKATGSYYTPEYIVKHIVENTLGPLVEEKLKEDEPIDRILSLKVLDPAMGSGHFLVEATDRLAHALVQALGGSEEEPEEDDIRWARREVVERCIYGVDLNPLAVELAKLSLWLHTVAEGKPLNFLDHHLKVGNSLIGACVDDLGSLPVRRKRGRRKEAEPLARQMNLFEIRLNEQLPVMLNRVLEIIRRGSETLEDIRSKEAADRAIEELKAPFKAVADLSVSTYFGNEVRPAEYQEALEQIGEPRQLLALPAARRALEIAEERRFFHWELEFPEVFYEDSRGRENPGFDAVVGNPPYVGTREMSERGLQEEKQYFRVRYSTAHKGFDLYIPFMEQALRLTQQKGHFGFIVPNKFWVTDYGEKMVSLLTSEYVLLEVADVSSLGPFRDASVYPHVVIARRRSSHDMSWKVSIIRGLQAPRDLSSDAFRTLTPEKYLISALHGGAREPSAIPTCRLAELSRVQAGTTGFLASAMSTCIQDGKPTDVSECRPFVVTGNIDRYEIVPAPVRYMGETYESPWCVFRPEVISHGKWRLFSQSKLLIGGMTTRLEAAYDRIGRALGVNVYAITEWELSPTYLLALLNSAYVTHVYRTMFESKHLAGGYLAINKGQLEEIPMRRILFATSQNERARLLATGRRRVESRVRPLDTECGKGAYQVFLGSELGQWVSTRLEVEPEQSDVIHDLLAHLADQMIDMNETKQAEAKGFLGWLEGYTGLPIEHWRLKTRVKAYWEHGWDEIRRALRQNRKTIEKASGRNVEGREALEAIQRELEQSVARLTPALERIASTDRLIDLIVYRLYGLTEEEVAMVEGE